MNEILFEICILVFAILLNGFFAASELAIFSSRRARLKHLADEKNKGAAAALDLIDNSGSFLSAVQAGITVISIFTGAYGGATLAEPIGQWLSTRFPATAPYAEGLSLSVVIVIITYASLVFGELVPKRVAIARAERIATHVSRPMKAFAAVAVPLVVILEFSSSVFLRLLGVRSDDKEGVTEEEVKTMIHEGTESGVFQLQEKQMLEGVLRLGDRTVRALMTPRPALAWLDLNDSPDVMREKLLSTNFSRLPLARGTAEEVLGIIYAKDVMNALLKGQPLDWMALKREPVIVHDGLPVLKLLELFRTTREQLAIVADEYGSVEGVVTLTDILEAVAGELPEADEGLNRDRRIVPREDGSFLVDGLTPVDEVEAFFGLKTLKGDGDYHTLAGFVLDRLDHIPQVGETFTHDDFRFEVVDMDGRRIDMVLMTPPGDAAEEGQNA